MYHKKRVKQTFYIFLVGSFLFFFSCFNNDKNFTIRSFNFIYHLHLPAVENISESIKLWFPLPQSDNYQMISNLTIKCDLPVSRGADPVYGNLIGYIQSENPLLEGLDVTISFDVKRYERSYSHTSISEEEQALYIAPTDKVPRDRRFEEIFQSVLNSSENVLKNGKTLYNHILDRMEYDKSGSGWGEGDAIYACDIGRGNCTDYHSLFNAVARTANIPSRFLIGFPIPDKPEGSIKGYHCWTEFYAEDHGWIPVDISEADKFPIKKEYLFGNLDPNRVLLSKGRDIIMVPPSGNGPVNYFIYPLLEIDGNRSTSYTTSFSFRSISG